MEAMPKQYYIIPETRVRASSYETGYRGNFDYDHVVCISQEMIPENYDFVGLEIDLDKINPSKHVLENIYFVMGNMIICDIKPHGNSFQFLFEVPISIRLASYFETHISFRWNRDFVLLSGQNSIEIVESCKYAYPQITEYVRCKACDVTLPEVKILYQMSDPNLLSRKEVTYNVWTDITLHPQFDMDYVDMLKNKERLNFETNDGRSLESAIASNLPFTIKCKNILRIANNMGGLIYSYLPLESKI